jgi:hypothetical protein
MKVYIGEKGRAAVPGSANADFLKRNGLAYGKLFVWKVRSHMHTYHLQTLT